MNKELGKEGIKSIALCPAFVDTPMTDFVKGQVPADEMIRPEDIAESVKYWRRYVPVDNMELSEAVAALTPSRGIPS